MIRWIMSDQTNKLQIGKLQPSHFEYLTSKLWCLRQQQWQCGEWRQIKQTNKQNIQNYSQWTLKERSPRAILSIHPASCNVMLWGNQQWRCGELCQIKQTKYGFPMFSYMSMNSQGEIFHSQFRISHQQVVMLGFEATSVAAMWWMASDQTNKL